MSTANEPAVLVEGLTRAYGARTVICSFDLRIERGEFVALIGEKRLRQDDAAARARRAGPRRCWRHRRVRPFQEHRLLPWNSLWRNVALGLKHRDARRRAAVALRDVGLGDRLDDWPRNLSGGQARRVALARALVQQPHLLLLDEPFAALDALTRIRVHGLVKRLVARYQPGVLLVTHDVDEAIALANRAVVMRNGTIVGCYAISPEANAHRSHLDAVALRDILLDQLGASADAA